MARKRAAHYVDGKKLTEALNEYTTRRDKAIEEGTEIPQMPEYIGDCILRIARKFANSYKWSRVPFKDREDLISSGAITAINAIQKKYDPTKMQSGSAFSFVTQTIYFGFLGVINGSQKQLNITTRLTGAFMDGQTDIGVNPDHQQFYNASLVDIREMIDNHKSSLEDDSSINHSKRHEDHQKAMIKSIKDQEKLEAEENETK